MEITDEFQTVTPFEISLLWLPLKNITLMKKEGTSERVCTVGTHAACPLGSPAPSVCQRSRNALYLTHCYHSALQ